MRAERFPVFMGGEADDVRRVLTILFRGITSIARPDLERSLSFDMEWVAPHEAEEVVDALLNKGWLKSEQGELHHFAPEPRKYFAAGDENSGSDVHKISRL